MNAGTTTIAAAIQVATCIGNTQLNLKRCKQLAQEASAAGAKWIALPEFFNTGVCWDPALVDAIEDENGQSALFMQQFSKDHSVVIGGSFLCRVPDGGVRNRYLCFNNGILIGKHDKDYPTMWESAFYEGGKANDTGVLGSANGIRIGTAVCWEFMRTGTARRLRNKVDVVIGGSHWWSMPANWPRWLTKQAESSNKQNTLQCVQDTARLIGAPVIHASHCNTFTCKTPGLPFSYQGHLEGNAAIINANGEVIALRSKEQGEGIVVAEIKLGAVTTHERIPQRFWLRNRTLLGAFSWYYHGALGRRWYRKHVHQSGPLL